MLYSVLRVRPVGCLGAYDTCDFFYFLVPSYDMLPGQRLSDIMFIYMFVAREILFSL
jgi:hypothetical protein